MKRQELRLAEASAASEKFIESMRAICNAQLSNLEAIATKHFDVKEKAAAEEPVRIIEEAEEVKPRNECHDDIAHQ